MSSNLDATTASAAYATETVSKEMQQMETHFRFPEEFRMPEVNSGGAVTKEDLGRATWTFLHTLAAQVHLMLFLSSILNNFYFQTLF